MKTNYLGWDQKSLAVVFCDFSLTAEIMAPSLHRTNENVNRVGHKSKRLWAKSAMSWMKVGLSTSWS